MFFAIGNLLWFLVALASAQSAAPLAVIAAKQFAKPSVKVDETPALADCLIRTITPTTPRRSHA